MADKPVIDENAPETVATKLAAEVDAPPVQDLPVIEPVEVKPTPVAAKAAAVPKAAVKSAPVAKKAVAIKKAAPIVAPKKIAVSVPKKAPVKTAPAASKPISKVGKVVSAAEPSIKNAAEKVTTMFSDLNVRAKAALEKTAKAGEELTEFSKGNVEALVASAKTAAKGAETLGQEAAEYGKKSFETATATLKSLSTVKSPTELFQIQSEYAKSSFDSAVAEASKFSEAWIKIAGDVFAPLSSRYTLAAEKFKAAAL